MRKPKYDTLALWLLVVTFATAKRDWIWDIIKPWPRWWKVLLYATSALFFCAVFLWSCGLDWVIYWALNVVY
jgi:hypothetical protein